MALSLNRIEPIGNVTKVSVDPIFLGEFVSMMNMASVHIVGSAECDDVLILKLQGQIVPASEFCSVEIARTLVDANEEHPGATAAIVFRPKG